MLSRGAFRALPFRSQLSQSFINRNISPHNLSRPSTIRWPLHRPSPVPATSRGYAQKFRPKYYRYDPDQVRNARPLLSQESIKGFFKHRNTHWGAIFLTSGGIWFYVSNLEEVPVSHRRRFNIYRPEDVEGEGARMYQQIMQQYGGAILPAWDRRTKMVHRVMARLVRANGLENVDWEVHVIASDEKNAFVIPGGKVFVFSGILPIAKTDDGLAAILGHEIAHSVANHAGESMSRRAVFMVPLQYLMYFLDNTGYTAGLGQLLGSLALEFGFNLPASRNQESEADFIGLMMMAKSCYNPQDAVGVWERMHKAQEEGGRKVMNRSKTSKRSLGLPSECEL
ncbi:mitochondrial metalloendopeptidase oma1 protein [Rutstroemia sp. NJR-2017a WRK4]|nr:mitochondrial metalloendopeptidase oma1 protein [Rutstroemia sp. NJR-2017a WRK4]